MAGNVLDVTDSTFDQEVLKSAQPVLVDFWAPWCGPCKMLSPTVEAIANDYAGRVRVVKVNTDDSRQAAMNYRIEGIPTLLLFKDGQPVERVVGLTPKDRLAATLDKHLG
ncbi:MAG: thioredoxin [Planctomyces sp.]|nr:thioredoxin [Planctomyces sp.]